MKRAERIILIVLMLALCLPCNTALAFGGPTAIIVDDETGEPIEGAIALAQWMKYSWLKRWGEGGTYYLTKAKETVSDKEGRIYIKGYWNWISFSGKPHLTVYKPGYALWNSKKEAVPQRVYKPKDFSSDNNVVRLVKFEKAAAEWKELAYTEFSKKRPRDVHTRFLSNCLETDLDTNAITLDEIFERYEGPLRREENVNAWREHEKSKQK